MSDQLKSAVYLQVAKAVEAHVKEMDPLLATTPAFVANLVELVYNQIVNLGEDLELFANHAGRTTVNTEDLYMVTRRNSHLTEVLRQAEATIRKKK